MRAQAQATQAATPSIAVSVPDPHVGIQPDATRLVGNTPMVRRWTRESTGMKGVAGALTVSGLATAILLLRTHMGSLHVVAP